MAKTDPDLRHDAARRLPGRGHRAHARGQAAHRRAARRLRRRLRRGRLAGLEPARRGVLRGGRASCARSASRSRPSARRAAPACAPARTRNLEKLLRAETPVVTIFGKSWDLHVRDDLRISLAENLEVIHDTVALPEAPRRRGDLRRRALLRRLPRTIPSSRSSACRVGGRCRRRRALPLRHQRRPPAGRDRRRRRRGPRRRCRRRSASTATTTRELAVANSLIAVEHGAVQVQGTINGIGERCGNANLCSVIANLQLKMGYQVVSAGAAAPPARAVALRRRAGQRRAQQAPGRTSARAPSRTRAACTSPPCSAIR